MRKARIYVNNTDAAVFETLDHGLYTLTHHTDYQGAPISLAMPLTNKPYKFDAFPAFFEGLLPEGIMLEALLRKFKVDRNDYFQQLITVGKDLVGAVTLEEIL